MRRACSRQSSPVRVGRSQLTRWYWLLYEKDISWPVAEILAGLGCSINEMGTESHINLANYNFSGPAPAKRNLRRAYNRMLDCGYTSLDSTLAATPSCKA